MGKNYLKINDLVNFSLVDPNLMKVQDDYEGAFKPDLGGGQLHHTGLGTINEPEAPQSQVVQNGLQVSIAATHSGIITGNNGFYLPEKMAKGTSSWTDSYVKPVLAHHEEKKDAIGRIVKSDYVDTSGSIQDAYDGMIVRNNAGKEVGTITRTLIKDFVGKKMPYGMQVDVVCSLLRDSLLNDSDYVGLGHIRLLASITDKQAIEKLLDGRYLTGSVGATTDGATCSICRQDWTEAGQCEHKPGGLYDSAKCFLIAGNLKYEEYSFVNVPADRHSGVLELHYNDAQIKVDIANDHNSRIYEAKLRFPQFDSVNKEEEEMAKKVKDAVAKPDVTDSNHDEPVIDNPDVSTPEGDQSVKTEEPVEDAKATDVKGDEQPVEGTPESDSGDQPVEDSVVNTPETSLDSLLDRIIDAKTLESEDEEKFYDMLWEDAVAAFEAGEWTLEQLKVENVEDAKLSTEKRKKLASSSFCGPDKSFPVPDRAHVTAARRLIDRYKGEGDKSAILACVTRKAKAMGCAAVKKDAVETPAKVEDDKDSMSHASVMSSILQVLEDNAFSGEEIPVLNDDEKGMLASILKRLSTQVGKDALQESLTVDSLAPSPECLTALEDEVVKGEEAMGDLRDELNALRKEYSLLFKDMETLQDAVVQEKSNTRKVRESHLTTLVTLKDGKVEERDFAKLEDASLVTEIARCTEEVDMVKIADKLGDGMSRVPTDSVDDPTVIHDTTQKSKFSVEYLARVEEQYQETLFKNGAIQAETFIKQLKSQGKLPRDED